MQKTILITGASGFLASHLLDSFVNHSFNVIIVKRENSDLRRISHLLSDIRVYTINDNNFDVVFLNDKIDIIVNCVCSYGRNGESIINIVEANLIFGLSLLNQAIKSNVKVFINTDSLLPKYINEYSLSKSHFSDWLAYYSEQIKIVNFRIEQMYGPRDDAKKFIPWLTGRMLFDNREINLTQGTQKRNFIYITDVVSAFLIVIKKIDKLSSFNSFDLATNTNNEVKEFVMILAHELEKRYNKNIISRLNFDAIPYRKDEVMFPEYNNSSLINLGWKPNVEINTGISEYISTLKIQKPFS